MLQRCSQFRVVRVCVAFTLGISLVPGAAIAAGRPATPGTAPWTPLDAMPKSVTMSEAWVRPTAYQACALDEATFRRVLDRAPLESVVPLGQSTEQIMLPMPDGSFACFFIVESPVMEPELAVKFPEIRTYLGQGMDDPSASLRCDWTPSGFHAQILSPNGAVYIDPYSKGDTEHYVSYYKRDYVSPGLDFRCLGPLRRPAEESRPPQKSSSSPLLEVRRTYRLACAATGEYTQYHGGTVSDGMAAITTAINRVTGIYEAEVAVRLVLIANNDWIVYTNGATDPYTNGDGYSMLFENQSNLNSVIGSSNYDIGHVFSTGGGGIAGLGVVCSSSQKAWGVTGLSHPIGDPFYVDYVAHEMGHQFDANHSFNGVNGSCCCGNRNASTAYEPGSGSTIMSYAGICGADNLQSHSDPYFHFVSYGEIRSYISGFGGSCAQTSFIENDSPTVSAGLNYSIPHSTPFVLIGSGSDPDGDEVTFCWEQRDLGPAAPLSAPDDGAIPLFRTLNPTTDPSRTCPRLSDLLNNTTMPGEKLPTVVRAMDFRLTGRDNRAGAGGVDTDDMRVFITDSGPFRVTFPNDPGSIEGVQTVTWDVAGTDASPVGATHVSILLSTDGGNTFPVVLAASTPNDGAETVTLPDVATATARVKIEAVGNIFFDISDYNFMLGPCAIADPVQPETTFVAKNRYLSFTPGNVGREVALRVTLKNLPAPFDEFNDTHMWVDAPSSISEVSSLTDATPPTFYGALLSCDAHCRDWGTIDLLHVSSDAIVPGGQYEIQAIDCTCSTADEGSYSAALALPTSARGDVVGDCAVTPCTPPNGRIDFVDISAVVEKFRNLPGAPIKARADLAGNVPDRVIDFLDISETVDAFRALPYNFDGPPGCE